MAPSPLTALVERQLEIAKALDAYNEAKGLAPVSFDHESFVELPPDLENQRTTLIDLAQDVKRLAQGPRDLLFESLNMFNDLANLQFIYHYNIPKYVPLDGDISYVELAAITGFDPVLLRRMIRVAMMNRIFIETDQGHVRHSAASRLLHQEQGGMDACGFFLEEMFPSAAKIVQAMEKYPRSGEPSETAFNMAHNTSRPFYLDLEADGERARRFGSAMRWMTQSGRFSNEHLIRGYDWAEIDREGGVMVDVGGGIGQVSAALAGATERMRFVVQDLPSAAVQGEKMLPAELKGRVSFMAHDFFEINPVEGADVYFFRYILHNWSDGYAEKILKAVIPALKDGSRIVCYEFLPGDVSTTAWSQKQPYNMDMIQAIGWNSIERTSSDWERLFKRVDSRLLYLGTRTPPGSSTSLIEAKFVAGKATNGIH